MIEKLEFQNKTYTLKRYPKTTDNSLRAWSNAEILALDFITSKKPKEIHLFNDRFGIWNCVLNDYKTTSILTYASQKKAVFQNLELNNLSTEILVQDPLEDYKNVTYALLKIPKSLELFELFLQQIHKASNKNTEVICCFMTKYFSIAFLKVASIYFEEIEQSKAWKKSRLLILKQPKQSIDYKSLINSIEFKNKTIQQYFGVFSSDKIDIGTQFLLEHLKLQPTEQYVLDVASGNGIIASNLAEQNPKIDISLIDDFNLAINSSQLNLKNYNSNFIWEDNLDNFPNNNFDIVVSNPPFHFEHENNIEVSLSLFEGVRRVLKQNGRFVLVANKHLNYKTHLSKIFKVVYCLSENNKFIIYECSNYLDLK